MTRKTSKKHLTKNTAASGYPIVATPHAEKFQKADGLFMALLSAKDAAGGELYAF
jgi:hypothetical protein